MKKLVIIPGACHSLGGTLVTLSLLIEGFRRGNAQEQLCVLVRSNSLMEKYLKEAGLDFCVKIIPADGEDQGQFLERAFAWVSQQPSDWPLLLDNCVWRSFLPIILRATWKLRLQNRSVYHFCHDLALSHNLLGYLARKFTFACLAPRVICNSHFTASHVRSIMPDIRGILYQPVDTEKFNSHSIFNPPPVELERIINSGCRIILTPSRISQPGMVNDKNLRALIPVLAHLKATGHNYHSVIIGEDNSSDRINSRTLLESAKEFGVSDRFTILPPSFAIENYYKYADIVLTLAPREPFGRIVVEAIACGVPVVGSETGGIGEILRHFAPEWIVDPNNPTAAAKAIIDITNNPNTPELLNKARNWVETYCNLTAYAQGMMTITGLTPPPLNDIKLSEAGSAHGNFRKRL
ncbi:MAG: glycosyltransferase [Cyanomargarita calcarea GSE-NOS-MK-12-04C]|jgi:glycosyltransferase involved in cell wall biosynthesis|uniref:Glycosyltransferase n=1 Tax=Cyanomargarita calcarea GSE-NOS-MK-12-04C TaxID=2839659 RepID=A0A951UY62_9CYAN|nr:glycosyltransferase [Cyanomargarita calcarea GSE-NOS-MK-12-04C]